MAKSVQHYPGGSKSRVNRAGDSVRMAIPTELDLQVIEEWRAAHRGVLNTFQAILRNRTKGTKITVAQRHKRKRTIFNKLHRFPKMQLSRMDDVAGCRLIFANILELYKFRTKFIRLALITYGEMKSTNMITLRYLNPQAIVVYMIFTSTMFNQKLGKT